MGKSNYVTQKRLTAAEQGYFLRFTFPAFCVATRRNILNAVGTLRPTALSDAYTIELRYDFPKRPRIQVLKPALQLAPGHTRLPHVYEENDLCLHVPGEWRPDLRIDQFIVPWISFWLYFYEIWLATGEWLGGGHEPPLKK
jgi:hypothetical protein